MTDYASIKLGEKYEHGFDWTTWLEGATISSSAWSVSPSEGLADTGETNSTTSTSVFLEAQAPGTYRVRNDVTDSAGRKGWDDLVLSVEGATTTAYLSASDAEARLWGRYGVRANLSAGDVEVASDELDASGPFVGHVTDTAQTRAFPRYVPVFGGADQTPEAVLDWVALCAYRLATNDAPPVTSESAGSVSRSFASPKPSQTDRRMARLLDPYLLRVGQRDGGRREGEYVPGFGYEV